MIPVALRISASAGADGPVVVLSGEADLTTTEMLREVLATQLGTGARLVTVDASELSFLDSASLRILVLAARALHARHGTLLFACPQAHPRPGEFSPVQTRAVRFAQFNPGNKPGLADFLNSRDLTQSLKTSAEVYDLGSQGTQGVFLRKHF